MSNKPTTPHLDLRQTQSQNLVMTQQMQQAVKILQLSNIELKDYLEEILEENPLLEKDETTPDSDDSPDDGMSEKEELLADNMDDFDEGSYMAAAGKGSDGRYEGGDDSLANTISDKKSLREHLVGQIQTSFSDQRDRMVATLLIDELDESGYLRSQGEELTEKLGCSQERLDTLLPELKHFEPTGIFAKDLAECLALQLEERGKLTDEMEILLDNLALLALHDYKKLASLCEVDENEVKDMATQIRSLQPKPASDYDHFISQTAIPDVLMKKQARELGGGWRVELNQDTLPRVLINNEYYTTVLSKSDKDDKTYIRNQHAAASWLVKALDQRAQTILKVAAEIVEEQNGFFLYGVEYLRPLTLKDIAEKIEMHESTVSRVTTNKFMGTPRGIFELKYFFTSSVSSSTGNDSVSSEAVKARIQSLIDTETLDNVLSDDSIVTLLEEQGIEVARRTVAKYRDALNIPSSVQRRKILKNKSRS
ncbi:MAG: RNA polymerase sigma-54 factor [Alphaproteobacteria bacterium]|nr:RNA polymerase sigma-54 factor [Alphaproteobacteria bacterium]